VAGFKGETRRLVLAGTALGGVADSTLGAELAGDCDWCGVEVVERVTVGIVDRVRMACFSITGFSITGGVSGFAGVFSVLITAVRRAEFFLELELELEFVAIVDFQNILGEKCVSAIAKDH
jgi:hypothetical protein